MIWASFDWAEKSSICFVDGRMNSNGYREVLKNHLVDIGNSVLVDQIGFFNTIMLLLIDQKLILSGSDPKKSMFYLVHRSHLI